MATLEQSTPATSPSESGAVPITVANGDGIGPAIMDATLRVLQAAGAKLAIETIEIGEKVYERGHSSGIEDSAWESLRRTKIFLKAPITTPQGGGFKSLNVTVRKTLGLYANIRPCVTYHPIVKTLHPGMDLVVVRENEEDLYAGIEHRQTDEVYQCLKLISRPGCEKIVRYAFEYARAYGRKKVTCMTKDNIMKLTDGLFHKIFDEIGQEYKDIEQDHWIIDIGMARAANRPENFDVIVLPNLYGDVLSDVTAEVAGSVGLAPSANIGDGCAMFEAIHGSAPRMDPNTGNPSGLFLAGVMMLVHLGQLEAAEKAHNAWLRTLEDGYHTKDVYNEATSVKKCRTDEFADAIIERLGQLPQQFKAIRYSASDRPAMKLPVYTRPTPQKKETIGVDVFASWAGNTDDLAAKLQSAELDGLKLALVTNRGVKVWPNGLPETFCTDHWRCRFKSPSGAAIQHAHIVELLGRLEKAGVDFIKTENLCKFDGELGYSLGQGE